MVTGYLVNRVLRVYQNQLCRKRKFVKFKDQDISSQDKNLLSEVSRKTINERLFQNIVNQLINSGPQYNIERDEFKLHPEDYRARLAISQKDSIFKEIDENAETINVLSFEDFKILRNRLEEIAKETLNKNLI